MTGRKDVGFIVLQGMDLYDLIACNEAEDLQSKYDRAELS